MLPSHRFKIAGLFMAVFAALAYPAKETLDIQIGTTSSTNVATILDTVRIWFDYEKTPETPAPAGSWAALEKDSSWTDDTTRNVRLSHAFMASVGTRKGYGNDFIFFRDFARCTPVYDPNYDASVSFTFPGDTTINYTWQPIHLQTRYDAFPLHAGLKTGYEGYGQVYKEVGTSTTNLAQGQWARVLKRDSGWTGYVDNPTAAMPLDRSQTLPSQGWFINLSPGAGLRVPTGAKSLRVFDIQGRLQWETGNVRSGASLALPPWLPRGALRFLWQGAPGKPRPD